MKKSTTTIIIVSMMLLSGFTIVPTLCATATTDTKTFDFEFVEGWNLFTIPLNVENNTVEALFGNTSYLPYCFGWNSTNQNYEIVYTLIPGYGYWIYVNESATCSINGSSITKGLSIDLATSKNLIGWVHNYTTTAEQICKTIPGCNDVGILSDENQIIDPNNVSYITHYNGSSENNFDITQGMGFWINVSIPSVWNGSAPPKQDKVNPTVNIVKPLRALYIKNKMVRKLLFRMALIIGGITIEVNATDSGSGIAKVEFYVNGKLKGNDTTAPYTYNLTKDKLLRFAHMQIIKVVAYDNAGNSAVAKMIVKKYL